MSKHYFEFKQMRIEQEHCAMKVSTDACIQGAWTPIEAQVFEVLDIGTGTGLLSLMLAQRSSQIHVDALEIDEMAFKQAKSNVLNSVFKDQINVLHEDARNWHAQQQYNLIICNPPFFTQSLQGINDQRNMARHNDSLSQMEMAEMIFENLKDDAYASILLPVSELVRWNKCAEAVKLFTSKSLLIKPFAHSAANRVVLLCSKKQQQSIEEELVIYKEPKVYTEAFIELLRPFYLYL